MQKLIDEFTEVFAAQKGEVHFAETERETTDIIEHIVEIAKCKTAVVGEIPESLRKTVLSGLRALNSSPLNDLRYTEALGTIAKADLGITWAEYVVAKQGALVEIASDDATRLASTLPAIHIVMASSNHVLPDLEEAMRKARNAVKDAHPLKRPVVTLISGPSKTADIEMRLLYGVHGPHEVHAVLIGWM